MKVRNFDRKEPDGPDCGCDNWYEHWLLNSESGNGTINCVGSDCLKNADVGGHVKKVGKNDENVYIIPICHSCNSKQEEYEVNDDTAFVHVGQTDKCRGPLINKVLKDANH